MTEKIIRLPQLQRFKTNADAAYQGKLTAGSNITISGNTISAQVTAAQQNIYNATITSAGWSGTSNTVSVPGIAAGDDVEIVGINPIGLTNPQINAAKNALYLITYGTTSNGSITFYALNGLPNVDIPVTIRQILNTNVTMREYYGGDNITISNGVISTPGTTYVAAVSSGTVSVQNNTVVKVGEVTLQPGSYVISYTCNFASNATGYRLCGISPNMNIDGYGIAFMDSQGAVSGYATQTSVTGLLKVSDSSYPSGRTFNLLARQNSGATISASPRCYYFKL